MITESQNLSETAMILAAGFGTRMRPLSDETPKPLLKVHGQPMLGLALDHLKKIGIKRVVVNGHYLADQIKEYLKTYTELETIFLYEDTILDTGGGVKQALPYFDGKPFLLLGGDMPWIDGASPTLQQLVDGWDPAVMDELMLLYPTAQAKGFDQNIGDFMCDADGCLSRHGVPTPRPYVWLSAQIVKPELYDQIDETVFSNNMIFDLCEKAQRLYGVVHKGSCYHVGTPSDLDEANRLLKTGEGWG